MPFTRVAPQAHDDIPILLKEAPNPREEVAEHPLREDRRCVLRCASFEKTLAGLLLYGFLMAIGGSLHGATWDRSK